MALELPQNFNNDIQGRDTSLVPLVLIGKWQDPWDTMIKISTNDYVHTGEAYNIRWKPLLLNIPSLKESIDIEKRNYKINSVNLDISNYLYEGKRFSELVAENSVINGSLINVQCRIFWASPSTLLVRGIDIDSSYNTYGDDYAFQVYYGTIRRYTHDDEKVRLVVEDRSQSTLHKDLPLPNEYDSSGNIVGVQRWLGTDDNIPDKYKNKPIPMVYGHVDKSPCVMSSAEHDLSVNIGDSTIIWDNIDDSSDFTILEENNMTLPSEIDQELDPDFFGNPLMIFYKDEYLTVKEKTETSSVGTALFDYLIDRQYTVVNNHIQIISKMSLPSADNSLMCHYFKRSSKIDIGSKTILGENSNYYLNYGSNSTFISDFSNLNNNDIDQAAKISTYLKTTFANSGYPNGYYQSVFDLGFNTITAEDYSYMELYTKIQPIIISFGGYSPMGIKHAFINPLGIEENWETLSCWDTGLNVDDSTNFPFTHTLFDSVEGSDVIFNNQSNIVNNQNNDTDIPLRSIVSYGISLSSSATGTSDHVMNVDIMIYEAFIKHHVIADNISNNNFYINIMGRAMHNILGVQISPTAPLAIQDILKKELNPDIDINVPYIDPVTPKTYDSWQYAFTVDKKINSKKLIEGLASTSPYIARFDNMGNFKFDVIEKVYDSSDHNPIPESDVIDFSFKRTPIEDVVTKIEFKYNWDYARGEFSGRRALDITNWACPVVGSDVGSPWESFDYYGLPVDNIESTLVIDDDRGKYIRSDATAGKFVCWTMSWHCNQHLIINVKLPLKWMNIEVGDIVEFKELLGGIAPYGIDYVASPNTFQTFQSFFKYFMVTDTNKRLDSVEISCIQMHKMWDDDPDLVDSEGNMTYD